MVCFREILAIICVVLVVGCQEPTEKGIVGAAPQNIDKITLPADQAKKQEIAKPSTQLKDAVQKKEVSEPAQSLQNPKKTGEKSSEQIQQKKSEQINLPENQTPKPSQTEPPRPRPIPPPQPQPQAQPQAQAQPNSTPNPPKPPQKPDPSLYCGKQAYLRRFVRKSTQRMMLVPTIYGFDMYVDSKDSSVSNMIANTGTWQPHYINLIGHIVKPGDKVLNLGSQSGLEALIMGKIVGAEGRLFVFQPYSFSNSLVTKNVELNGLKDITTIYKVGASDKKSTGTINVYYSNTGGSEIVPIPKTGIQGQFPASVGQTQTVQTDRVDALLPPDTKLDFALIDVQKMQIKALQGMKEIIDRSPNLVIMTEWQYASNRFANRQQTTQLLDYFVKKGYKIYMYTGGDIVKCTVGPFYEIKDYTQLFRLNLVDLFFFPQTVELPK